MVAVGDLNMARELIDSVFYMPSFLKPAQKAPQKNIVKNKISEYNFLAPISKECFSVSGVNGKANGKKSYEAIDFKLSVNGMLESFKN